MLNSIIDKILGDFGSALVDRVTDWFVYSLVLVKVSASWP